jgi:superfamily II DNA/RNA helicase
MAGAQAGTVAELEKTPGAPLSSPSSEAASSVEETNSITFADLGLGEAVLKAVTDSGYTKPTPIQAQGIPEVLKGRDLIGIAQTGTGKTASFTLPMIDILSRGRAKARMPRTLILEPTRELAAQVSESFERYGKYNKLSMALLIGGVSFDEQDRKLDRGVDVLIATPGRLLDHFERGKLMLSGVQILVIDEADRMLDMGFIPDVERICKLIPFTRQTLFYSATMPPEIQRLTQQFLQAPVRVEVSRPATAATTITQILVPVPGGDWSKREALRRLIRENNVQNAIVFCNRKRDVDVVAKSLQKHGFSAAPLHGDLDQSVRTKTLESFKNSEIQLLVASDVAARGLDIPAVGHIFNYDVPFHADDYVHRIGRTGRAGRTGFAYTLAGRNDDKNVAEIEKLIGTTITRQTIELPEEIAREPRGDRGERGNKHSRGGRNRGGRGRDRHEHGTKSEAVKSESAAAETFSPAPSPAKTVERPPVKTETQRVAKPVMPKTEHPVRHQRQDHNADKRPTPVPRELLPDFLLRPVILPPATEKPVKKKAGKE